MIYAVFGAVCSCQLLIGILLSLWAIYRWVWSVDLCECVCVYELNECFLMEKIISCYIQLYMLKCWLIFYPTNPVLSRSQMFWCFHIAFCSFEIFNHFHSFQMTIFFFHQIKADSNSNLFIYLILRMSSVKARISYSNKELSHCWCRYMHTMTMSTFGKHDKHDLYVGLKCFQIIVCFIDVRCYWFCCKQSWIEAIIYCIYWNGRLYYFRNFTFAN